MLNLLSLFLGKDNPTEMLGNFFNTMMKGLNPKLKNKKQDEEDSENDGDEEEDSGEDSEEDSEDSEDNGDEEEDSEDSEDDSEEDSEKDKEDSDVSEETLKQCVYVLSKNGNIFSYVDNNVKANQIMTLEVNTFLTKNQTMFFRMEKNGEETVIYERNPNSLNPHLENLIFDFKIKRVEKY